MDPNEALKNLREAAEAYDKARSHKSWNPEAATRAAAEMWKHFNALDEWLTTGGFLPADWKKD